MKFSISRDALLKPLNLVAGVVERRQTLPILANVLMVLDNDRLSLTGTDLEVELVGRVQLATAGESGEVTVPVQREASSANATPKTPGTETPQARGGTCWLRMELDPINNAAVRIPNTSRLTMGSSRR